jgi:hypothetical protein
VSETRRPRSPRLAKSPDIPGPPPPQSSYGDAGFPGELGALWKEIGGLTEAVDTLKKTADSLKEAVKEQGKEIDAINKDVHAVKVTGRVLLWFAGIFGALFLIVLSAYLRQVLGGK